MGRTLRARAPPATEASSLIPEAVRVTAVLVARDGGDYLPSILAAVAAQTRPADAVFAADTGSTDDSFALLQNSLGAGRVLSRPGHRGGFGAAVTAVLDEFAPAPGTDTQWLWLLHDDAEPAPDALAELLTAAERAPSVTVAGCKQLDFTERRRLLDVGLSASRWAERVTLIETDEQDQGQYNGRSDVLAVNSAGMLVRRDVWDRLGGIDPALPASGDDVDLGWRNWLSGNRVVVVPTARMYHAADRPHAAGTPLAARRAEIYLRLKHAPAWQLPFLLAGALAGGVLRLVAAIALKDPGYGLMQLAGSVAGLAQPLALRHGRASAARTRTRPRSVVRGLQSSRRDIRAHRRSVLEALMGDSVEDSGLPAEPSVLEPSGDSLDDFAALATTRRLWSGTGALVSFLLLTAVGFIVFFRLVGASAVTGGALLPLSAGLGAIFDHASGWWITLGAGLPGHGDPFGYVLWLLAVAGFGHGSAAVAWLVVLALPLSGLGAWFASGALTLRRWPRFAAAFVWAGAPVLQVALGQGRLGAMLAHILLPWAVLGLIRAVGAAVVRTTSVPVQGGVPQSRPGTGGVPSWTAAAAGGLALAGVTASAPLLLVPAIAAVVLATIALRRRARTLWWSLLPSLVLFVPLAISSLGNPRALLADPGVALPSSAAPLWQQLLGQPVRILPGAGISGLSAFQAGPASWGTIAMVAIAAPLLILAVAGALRPSRSGMLARACWFIAALGLLAGYLSSTVATGVAGFALVTPFAGPAVSLAFLMLLAAAVLGLDGIAARAARRRSVDSRYTPLAVVAGLLAAAMIAAPVLSIGLFTARALTAGPAAPANQLAGAGAPDAVPAAGQSASSGQSGQYGQFGVPFTLAVPDSGILPATASDRGNGPESTRTLVLNVAGDSAVGAALMRGDGTTLDSLSTIASAGQVHGAPGYESVTSDPVGADIRSAVAAIVAGTGVDPRPLLTKLGVGFVVLKHGDTAAELLAGQIDAVPGLATVGPTGAGWLWRVQPAATVSGSTPEVAARVRLVDGSGAVISFLPSAGTSVDTRIAAGAEGRVLVLAERADPGWTATLDGHRLTSISSGWAQAFTVPAGAGHLEVRYDRPWAVLWNVVQIVVLGLTALMAVPLPTRRGRRRPIRGSGSAVRQVPAAAPIEKTKAGVRG
ncbi:MAG: glycosyltransferase [Actinomycetales bacterium]